jgi:hypothetical protein
MAKNGRFNELIGTMKFSCNDNYDDYVIHAFVISLQLCHPIIYHSNLSPTIYLSKSTAIYLLKSIPPFSNYWLYIRGDNQLWPTYISRTPIMPIEENNLVI